MSIPRVYAAINAVAAELAKVGLPKGHINLEDQYAYRGIDDVYNRIGPVLARHRLCVLPRVLERTCAERTGSLDLLLLHVTVRAAFDFVSVEDGSAHTVEAFGEALDPSDKGTAKAMQSAYKYALLQAFCIPLGAEDADASSPRIKATLHTPEPVQGWEQWSVDIIDMIRGCASPDAIGRVQDRYRALLTALSRERSDLYAGVGEAVSAKRAGFARDARNDAPADADLAPHARKCARTPAQGSAPTPAAQDAGAKSPGGTRVRARRAAKAACAQEAVHA
jgi:hypothetical protein